MRDKGGQDGYMAWDKVFHLRLESSCIKWGQGWTLYSPDLKSSEINTECLVNF